MEVNNNATTEIENKTDETTEKAPQKKTNKNMGKIIGIAAAGVAVVVVIILCFVLLGSGKKDETNNNSNGNNDDNSSINENNSDFAYGQDYIDQHLKGDYLIAYTVTTYSDGDSDSTTIEIRKTDKGYYYSADGSEILFIKNGDAFDMYSGSDGSFMKIGVSYDKETVQSMMLGVAYMTSYASFATSLAKIGSGTIAGRACDKYEMDYSHPLYDYKFKYTYFIDKATGVGLKFSVDAASGGQKSGYEYEATKFQTSGVTLPNYQ